MEGAALRRRGQVGRDCVQREVRPFLCVDLAQKSERPDSEVRRENWQDLRVGSSEE